MKVTITIEPGFGWDSLEDLVLVVWESGAADCVEVDYCWTSGGVPKKETWKLGENNPDETVKEFFARVREEIEALNKECPPD